MKSSVKILFSLLAPTIALCFDVVANAQTLPAVSFPSSLAVFVLYAVLGPNKVIEGTTIPDLGFIGETHYTAIVFLVGVAQWFLVISLLQKLRKRDKTNDF